MLSLDGWLQKLGIQKVDMTFIKTALTHSSYKGMGNRGDDNERLEFLGDAVLDLVNANLLYNDKELTEGDMTEKRKSLVSNSDLAELFNDLGMKNYVLVANNFNLSNKVKADFIEALFGAVFASKGYQKCFSLWCAIQNKAKSKNKNIVKNMKSINPKKRESMLKNAKSTLLEFCQGHFFELDYDIINREGPDHDPLFTVRVSIGPGNNQNQFGSIFKLSPKQKLHVFSDGKGKTKKRAEMDASQKLCDIIGLFYST